MTSNNEHSLKNWEASSKFHSNLSHSHNKCIYQTYRNIQTNSPRYLWLKNEILSSFRSYYSEKRKKYSKKLDFLPDLNRNWRFVQWTKVNKNPDYRFLPHVSRFTNRNVLLRSNNDWRSLLIKMFMRHIKIRTSLN